MILALISCWIYNIDSIPDDIHNISYWVFVSTGIFLVLYTIIWPFIYRFFKERKIKKLQEKTLKEMGL